MPQKDSAKKALRQAKKRMTANLKVKRSLKETLKTAEKAIVAKVDKAKLAELLKTSQQALDKAAKKGVIKKRNASRSLSRLAARVKKATS